MSDTATLTASLEDYLEAIFHIVERKQAARAKDISKRMQVNGSSVTGALRALSERNLVNYAPYDIVTLTAEGERVARDVVRRHEALHDFFRNVLGVDEGQAEEAACKMEHAMPRAIFERFLKFLHFLDECPRAGTEWAEEFRRYCANGGRHGDCVQCKDPDDGDARRDG